MTEKSLKFPETPTVELEITQLTLQVNRMEELLVDHQTRLDELEELCCRMLDTIQTEYIKHHWREVPPKILADNS